MQRRHQQIYPKLRCVLFFKNSHTRLHCFHDFRLISDRLHNQSADVRSLYHHWCVSGEVPRSEVTTEARLGVKVVVSAANNSSVVTFSIVASKDNQ